MFLVVNSPLANLIFLWVYLQIYSEGLVYIGPMSAQYMYKQIHCDAEKVWWLNTT